MANLHLETKHQNLTYSFDHVTTAHESSEPKTRSTLQVKASSKNEIILTPTQLLEATWLFKQYGIKKPGWLRKRFVINQRRRKLLNDLLWEAGLDGSWCGPHVDQCDWSGLLHTVWHIANGRSLCT